MCFSAGTSFATSALLVFGGGASFSQVKSKSQMLFASIPLLFALQQLIEGLIWLAIRSSADAAWLTVLAGCYLFFAYVVWPLVIPLSLYMLENDSLRRRTLLFLAGIGIVFAISALVATFDFTPHVIDNHLMYGEFPNHWLITLAYLCATILPFFVVQGKVFKIAGVFVALSLGLSWLISYMAIGSLWCFFSAVLSFGVFAVLRYINRAH